MVLSHPVCQVVRKDKAIAQLMIGLAAFCFFLNFFIKIVDHCSCHGFIEFEIRPCAQLGLIKDIDWQATR